jgi:hypothetical protein
MANVLLQELKLLKLEVLATDDRSKPTCPAAGPIDKL